MHLVSKNLAFVVFHDGSDFFSFFFSPSRYFSSTRNKGRSFATLAAIRRKTKNNAYNEQNTYTRRLKVTKHLHSRRFVLFGNTPGRRSREILSPASHSGPFWISPIRVRAARRHRVDGRGRRGHRRPALISVIVSLSVRRKKNGAAGPPAPIQPVTREYDQNVFRNSAANGYGEPLHDAAADKAQQAEFNGRAEPRIQSPSQHQQHNEDGQTTKLLQSPVGSYFTYNRVPWKLNVRKEVGIVPGRRRCGRHAVLCRRRV